MEDIHSKSDCYVSFSSSEGVGMGAVEAAVRNKPVIITDYGGATEYIETPYTINVNFKNYLGMIFYTKKVCNGENPM